MIGEVPAFPPISGTEQLPIALRRGIASRAWEKAEGDDAVFQRLCLQHARGEIDLYADAPAETDATERVRAAQIEREVTAAVTGEPIEPIEPVAPAPSPAANRAADRVEAATAAADRRE